MSEQVQARMPGGIKVALILSGIALTAAFFLPWVSWAGHPVAGSDFPSGHFFAVSRAQFGVDNPFPRFSFINYICWLIPVAALACLVAGFRGKSLAFTVLVAGVLSLSLATIYLFFTKTLVMLGGVPSLSGSLRPGFYLSAAASVVLLVAGLYRAGWFWRLVAVAIGPVVAFAAFTAIGRYLENKTFDNTADIAPAYTVEAFDLIREFDRNDSAAGKKYLDKIVLVHGRISEIDRANDSTINIRFIDTTGSYAIFPFYSQALQEVRSLQAGDSVGIKAACSGDVYSEILETRIINFERCILNKN